MKPTELPVNFAIPVDKLRTIRTLANSDLGQFGPQLWLIRTLVNSDLDHWSKRTL